MGKIPDVLASSKQVMERARFARIDPQAAVRFAGSLGRDFVVEDERDLAFHGSRADCAQFVLLTDALNFCFWSEAPWEVEYRGRAWTRTYAMLAGVLRAIEADRSWLTAPRWADATDEDIARIFAGRGKGDGGIPLLKRRGEVLRETGRVLSEVADGSFVTAVDALGGDARALAYWLAERFESFRDVAIHDGEPVAFLKRAQICAADLHRAWLANGYDGLVNMDRLTVFADYRLPQLFREVGILWLDEALAKRIDDGLLIEAQSVEEVELRAATICVGQLLADALQAARSDEDKAGARAGARTGTGAGAVAVAVAVAVWQLDYELWIRARAPEVATPHHRTLTHFY